MRLIVTGTAGFIGSSFARMALGWSERGRTEEFFPGMGLTEGPQALERLVSLDKLTYAGRREHLDSLDDDPRHVFVEGDIRDSALLENLVQAYEPEWIVNFAAESHVDRSIEGSEPFVQSNVVGTLRLLEMAHKHGLKFLQISTDEVYGSLGDQGYFTEHSPLSPNSPYSASKAAADCFVQAYVKTHELHAVITRSSNNYGPRQHPEKFLPVAIAACLRGEMIPVYGEGLNVRDWLHVEDHCYAVWLALTRAAGGAIYNVGGFGEMSNIELARRVCRALGRDPEETIRLVEDRKGHDWRYSVEPQHIVEELGWNPRWRFDEGLAHTVEHYYQFWKQ